jgi:hypothetical protein
VTIGSIQGRFSLLHRSVVPVLWRAVINGTLHLFRIVRGPHIIPILLGWTHRNAISPPVKERGARKTYKKRNTESVKMHKATKQWQSNRYLQQLMRDVIFYFLPNVLLTIYNMLQSQVEATNVSLLFPTSVSYTILFPVM